MLRRAAADPSCGRARKFLALLSKLARPGRTRNDAITEDQDFTHAAPADQGRARRHRRAGRPADGRGIRGLSRPPGQDRRGQYTGGTIRHHRPHHGGGDAGGDGRFGHRGEQGRRRRQYRHGICRARRCRRLHHPALDQRLFGQSRPLQHPAIRPVQGFRRRMRACGLAPRVRGDAGPGGQIDEGVRRPRQGQSRQIQRLHAADRNHAAAPGRSAEAARRPAEDGDHRLSRRRRRAQGLARRAPCS